MRDPGAIVDQLTPEQVSLVNGEAGEGYAEDPCHTSCLQALDMAVSRQRSTPTTLTNPRSTSWRLHRRCLTSRCIS